MRNTRTTSLVALGLGIVLLPACRSTAGDETAAETNAVEAAFTRDVSSAEPVTAPMVVDDSIDNTWDYLALKYDVDGDGRITTEEYDRGETGFGRIDRNDDGVVDASDFARRDRGSRDAQMNAMRAQMIVGKYFQVDDDAEALQKEELEAAIAAYDGDEDGAIDEAEFTCGVEANPPVPWNQESGTEKMMARRNPWETLLAGVDGDDDGTASTEELVAFFDQQDDGDGVLSLNRNRGRGGSGAGNRSSGGERPPRPAAPEEGTVAPDFTISSMDGEATVTLSSFRGDRPVALIFGSYT